jgi:hypothetical protein
VPNTTRHGVAAMLMSLECDVRAGVRGTHWSVRFTLECVVHAGVRGSRWSARFTLGCVVTHAGLRVLVEPAVAVLLG